MRIDTRKFLFIGINDEKDIFFEKAQDIGVVQFIDMHPKGYHEISSEVENIVSAIKVLRGLPPVLQEETEEYALADGIAYKITQLKDELNKLQEEERVTKLEIARVSPFGNFSLSDIEAIEKEGNRKIQFFCAKPHLVEIPEEVIYINTDQGLDYYIAINESSRQYDDMIEMHIEKTAAELLQNLEIVRRDIRTVEDRIKKYAKYNDFLHKAYIFKMDSYNLKSNIKYADTKIEGELFVVEGWVPETKLEKMTSLVEEMHIAAEEIKTDEEDVAPTCLENSGYHRIGEDLVHIYDTPSNSDKDPSMWVLVWFSLFFAMIIGDGGYGLIFLATALYLRYKFGPMESVGRRVWKLMVVLSAACIGWGVLTGSFFGLSFEPTDPIRQYSALNWLSEKKLEYHINHQTKGYEDIIVKYPDLKGETNPKIFFEKGTRERDGQIIHELADGTANGVMMELALLFGIIHVCLGMARYVRYNYAWIGWIIAIIGGLLYVPVYLNVPSILNYVFGLTPELAGRDGVYLMAGGFSLACLLSLYQHKIMGVLEPVTIIQIFADILSYLRLYALGLAGGIVSATVNGFGVQAGPILAIFVLIIGHSINILLSIMGGVIHGLRLNFLEWYHYCFEGGGKRYDPLRKLAKEL